MLNFFYVDIDCEYKEITTGDVIPCDVIDGSDTLATVWEASIAGLINTCWQGGHFDKSISCVLLGLILPALGMMFNVRLAQIQLSEGKETDAIIPFCCLAKWRNDSKLHTLLLCLAFCFAGKAGMCLLFGCLMFISAYYQSMMTPQGTLPGTELYQQVLVYADIGTACRGLAVFGSSAWSVYTQVRTCTYAHVD